MPRPKRTLPDQVKKLDDNAHFRFAGAGRQQFGCVAVCRLHPGWRLRPMIGVQGWRSCCVFGLVGCRQLLACTAVGLRG